MNSPIENSEVLMSKLVAVRACGSVRQVYIAGTPAETIARELSVPAMPVQVSELRKLGTRDREELVELIATDHLRRLPV